MDLQEFASYTKEVVPYQIEMSIYRACVGNALKLLKEENVSTRGFVKFLFFRAIERRRTIYDVELKEFAMAYVRNVKENSLAYNSWLEKQHMDAWNRGVVLPHF